VKNKKHLEWKHEIYALWRLGGCLEKYVQHRFEDLHIEGEYFYIPDTFELIERAVDRAASLWKEAQYRKVLRAEQTLAVDDGEQQRKRQRLDADTLTYVSKAEHDAAKLNVDSARLHVEAAELNARSGLANEFVAAELKRQQLQNASLEQQLASSTRANGARRETVSDVVERLMVPVESVKDAASRSKVLIALSRDDACRGVERDELTRQMEEVLAFRTTKGIRDKAWSNDRHRWLALIREAVGGAQSSHLPNSSA
jgi:hypothetical protein